MPPRRLEIAFVVFWFTLGLVVFDGSIRTFVDAAERQVRGPAHVHVALLAGVEAVAAALFLFPWTLTLGAIGLLATFGVAFVAHGLAGQLRLDLLFYAAGTFFVLIHGPVSWRMLRGRSAARSA